MFLPTSLVIGLLSIAAMQSFCIVFLLTKLMKLINENVDIKVRLSEAKLLHSEEEKLSHELNSRLSNLQKMKFSVPTRIGMK